MIATQIAGSSKNNRSENDFYSTPSWCTEELLKREKFEGRIWEPACGTGAISKVFLDNGYFVVSSDIVNRGFPCGERDFLKANYDAENIITNPPFSLLSEFIEHAKKNATKKIAFFLKTTALEGNKRADMWMDKDFPFARMYQFVNRVNFGKAAGTHKNGGMIAFAWFVWDKDHKGAPEIYWIK